MTIWFQAKLNQNDPIRSMRSLVTAHRRELIERSCDPVDVLTTPARAVKYIVGGFSRGQVDHDIKIFNVAPTLFQKQLR